MTPRQFWLKAAEWGSCMHNGDPGACMYGFNESGRVQSEEHRQRCLDYIERECREANRVNMAHGDPDATAELDALVAYLETAPLE